jgi:phosphoglycerate dehydrogenase-like enzyme
VLLTRARSPNFAAVVALACAGCTPGTGVNAFPFGRSAIGAHLLARRSARPIAEWTLAVMLAAREGPARGWIQAPAPGASRRSESARTPARAELGIGLEVARLALAFGMRVRALRRRRPEPVAGGSEVVRDLGALLRDADHLVLAAPVTKATRHLIDGATWRT